MMRIVTWPTLSVAAVSYSLSLVLTPSLVMSAPIFSEESVAAGITLQNESVLLSSPNKFAIMGAGIAWIDYDNDDRLDLFIPNGRNFSDDGNGGPSRLYYNTGPNGSGDYEFQLVALPPVLDFQLRSQSSTGVAVGDYDGDGFDDLFITNLGRNTLLHNIADATAPGGRSFMDVTVEAGLGTELKPSFVGAFGDLDEDGDLDLVVGHWEPNVVIPCTSSDLYLNNGNGTFTEIATQAGADDPGCTFGVVLTDYDNDGDLDIQMVNDSLTLASVEEPGGNVRAELYRNDGLNPGTGLPQFVPVAVSSQLNYFELFPGNGATENRFAGMGVAIGDYDGDWDLDYYRSNIGKGPLSTNDGDGTFTTIEIGAMLGDVGWGSVFFDADNDGDVDLYRGNSGAAFGDDNDISSSNEFYQNDNGSISNTNSAASVGLESLDAGNGVAKADYDNDGFVDMIVHGAVGRIKLFRNEPTGSNNWLKIQLAGSGMNPRGIGARLLLITGDGRRQMREIHGGSSHGSTNSFVQHIGLGANSMIDLLIIQWPDGCVQDATDLISINTLNTLTYSCPPLTIDWSNNTNPTDPFPGQLTPPSGSGPVTQAFGAGFEFRFISPSGLIAAGGEKNLINGNQSWIFGVSGLLTSVVGTDVTPGALSSQIGADTGLFQNADVFSLDYGFLAPTLGSAAAGIYGPGRMVLVSTDEFSLFFPVMEAQWSSEYFQLGLDNNAGIRFDCTGLLGGTVSCFGEHLITPAEDPGSPGFLGEDWIIQIELHGALSPLDSDGDGLTNTEELAAGTDPTKSDTDRDGVLDPDEVNLYQTNPVDPDTDRDGASDGIEVEDGTDPTNPQSSPILGDINDDGLVNVADVILATRLAQGLEPMPAGAQFFRANVGPLTAGISTPDNIFNVGDLLLINRKALGVITF